MKSLILFVLSTVSMQMYAGTFGTAADTMLTAEHIAASAAQSRGSGSGPSTGQNCQSQQCASTDPATVSLPAFAISLWNANSTTTPINSIVFPTNQVQNSGGFWVNNALLTVHIFPPSNIITNSTVTTPQGAQNSYAIMYTLKSLDGNTIQKVLQYVTPAAGSTPATSVMPISPKGVPIIPTSISITAIPSTTDVSTLTQAQILTLPQTLAPNTFLPNISKNNVLTQQRILNAISPLSQKFLINSTAGTINITPISTIFDTEDGSTLMSSFSGQSGLIQPTSGANAQLITVTLSDSTPNTVSTPQIFNQPFNSQDIKNGLALNVHIFPPSTNSTNPNYLAFATLRTLDGLKLIKLQFPAFTTQPAQLSINYGSAINPQFSTIFINPAITSENLQPFNLISPINLRCLLQLNSNNVFTVSMM